MSIIFNSEKDSRKWDTRELLGDKLTEGSIYSFISPVSIGKDCNKKFENGTQPVLDENSKLRRYSVKQLLVIVNC